jgi:hypothetical protein
MTKLLLIGGALSLVTAFAGTLLALLIQQRWLSRDRIEREAWEHAQEAHQLNWEKQQKKRATDSEWKIAGHVEQIQNQWTDWLARDQERANQLRLEYELRHLPGIDAIPLSLRDPEQAYILLGAGQPPIFDKADLRGYDFSQRYLGQAHLQDADLAGANFYMADLRDACLAGANLSNANLTGANLSGADLRGATLAGATLLVADLRATLLHGANLLGARSLTSQQLYMAHYDHTTLLDQEIDLTIPRLPKIPSSATDPGLTTDQIQHVWEMPPSLPQAPNDSQSDAWVTSLPEDMSENNHTEEPDTAIPAIKLNGTLRAMVN